MIDSAGAEAVFPALAGMNRGKRYHPDPGGSAPRVRGDEPDAKMNAIFQRESSGARGDRCRFVNQGEGVGSVRFAYGITPGIWASKIGIAPKPA